MEISVGDKVRIVGNCEATNEKYSVVIGMKKYMHTEDLYNVDRVLIVDGEIVGIRTKSYSWHIDDIEIVKKIDDPSYKPAEPQKLKDPFFKFDDKLLKSIVK